MRLGITGHQRLHEVEAWRWVEQAIQSVLAEAVPPLVGFSCLAIGADQIFAELVLQQGGELRVILPFKGYETTLAPGADLDRYCALLAQATEIEVLCGYTSREMAYLAAGQRVIDLSDRVIAIWNGDQAAGLGGTGDIVSYALQMKKDIVHINPTNKTVKTLPPKA